MTRRRRSLMTTSHFHIKQLMLRNGSMTRMQCIAYDCQRRRIKGWNSGRQSHLQSSPALRYLEIVSIARHLKMENELMSKGLQQHSSSCTDVSSRGQPMAVKEHLGWRTRQFGTFYRSDNMPRETWAD